ncbi:MAG: SAM-dependent methyltransferase, partial [Acidimicrobiia bacterium]|nr:SAM-dependent methyltransferase [Acidimicrobiia bacterium]
MPGGRTSALKTAAVLPARLLRSYAQPVVDAHHQGYWDATVTSQRDALRRTNQLLADRVELAGGERVLDLGCGTGGSVEYLQRDRRAQWWGTTLDHSDVAAADRLRAPALGGGAVCADAAALPFTSNF